jgi:hypothetical protein
MRVRVDRETLAPVGVPEYLGGDKMMDDFCIDEDAGAAYVTAHRENTIDRMCLEPDRDAERENGRQSVRSRPRWTVEWCVGTCCGRSGTPGFLYDRRGHDGATA